MNKDELLTEAIRRYPIGTKVISAFNNKSIEVMTKTPEWFGSAIAANLTLYYHGQWARVISYPEGYKYIPNTIQKNYYEIY